MKEHPILFSAPMVRAILEGRKTQTRRVVTKSTSSTQAYPWQGKHDLERAWRDPGGLLSKGEYLHAPIRPHPEDTDEVVDRIFPKWEVGDRLWVKETHQLINQSRALFDRPCREEITEWGDYCVPYYRATDLDPEGTDPDTDRKIGWRSSIHMPRWASRILLEITAVRVERVQNISEADAQAEGCERLIYGVCQEEGEYVRSIDDDADEAIASYRDDFHYLWNFINSKRGFGWDANPWVWVIEFRRTHL